MASASPGNALPWFLHNLPLRACHFDAQLSPEGISCNDGDWWYPV